MNTTEVRSSARPKGKDHFAWAFFLLLLSPAAGFAQTPDHFHYIVSPSDGTYNVNDVLTFQVEAHDAGHSVLSGFNGAVTLSLSQPFPNLGTLADPRALFTNTGNSDTGTGTIETQFTSGVLDLEVVPKSGTDDATLFLEYNGTLDIAQGNYVILGFFSTFYPVDAGGNTLTASAAVAQGAEMTVNLPTGEANAVSFVASSVNGSYAAGGAQVLGELVARVPSGTGSFQYQVILDYNGNLTAPYTPIASEDTVYYSPIHSLTSTFLDVYPLDPSADPFNLPLDTSVGGGFDDGQVILKVWKSSGTGTPQIRIRNNPVSLTSSIAIPYNDSNISPVRGVLTPKEVLVNSTLSMIYALENFSNLDMYRTRFRVPPNPSGAGVSWHIQSTPTTDQSGAAVTFQDPVGSTPGYVDIDWTSNPVTIGETAHVTLSVSAPATALADWDFSILYALDTTGATTILSESSEAKDITTLGAPSPVSGLAAAPINFTGLGGQAALSWSAPVTDQQANGYVIQRRSPAGSGAFAPLTVLSGSAFTSFTDTTAVNLTSYDYEVSSKNNVTSSAPVTSSPVTAFVNPGPPTGVTAQTGDGTVRLNWATPTPVTGGLPLGGFRIFRDSAPSMASATTVTTTGLVTTYDDVTATNGTTWYYHVASVDDQAVTGTPGTGAHISTASTPVISGFPPGNPPTGAGTTLVNSSPATIRFSWTAPVSNIAAPVSYVIERGSDAGPLAYYTEVPASAVSILDDAVTAGSFYTYRVAGVDAGPVTTNFTAAVTGRVGPSAPGGFTASPSSPSGTAVTLTWNPNPAPEGVVNYRIYRNSVFLTQTGASPTSFLNNSGLVVGTDYVYEIEAVDSQPVTGPMAAVTTALRPTTPAGLAASTLDNVTNDIQVNWNSVLAANANAVSLTVFRHTAPTTLGMTPFPVTPASATAATVTGNTANTPYYFWLQTHNGFGSSALAGPVTAITYPATVFLGTLSLDPATGYRSVTFGTLTAPVTGYQVHRATTILGPYVPGQVISGASPTMPVTLTASIQPGQIYYYKVRALNPTGAGPDSNIQAINIPPSVPIGLTAVSGVSDSVVRVDVSWQTNAPIENVNSYNLYRSNVNTSPAAYGTPIANILDPTATYTDSAVTGTGVYYYILAARSNDYPTTPDSMVNTANAVAVTAFALPNLPSGMAVTAGTGQVFLGWTAPSQTTYPIVGYNIYRSTSSPVTGGLPLNATPVPGTAFTASGLTNLTPYYFAVRTVDSAGNLSSLSSEVSETPVVRPNPPTSMAASPGDREVALTWVPPAAPPGSLSPQSYLIYRRTPPTTGPITLIAQIGVTFNGYNDNNGGIGVTTGVTYEYWVQTVDSSGVTSVPHISLESTHVTGTPAVININPPSNVVGIAGNGTFQIDWVDSFTPGAAVTGYGIWRRMGTTGAFSGLTTIGSGVQTYTDNTVTNGNTFYYYLVAIADTFPVVVSSNSSTVFGTPVPPPGSPAGLSAADGDTQVTLTWAPVAGTGVVTIQNYVVYQNAVSIDSVSGAVTSYTAGSLSNGTSYTFTVSAVNSNGTEGSLSLPIIGRPFHMEAPVGVGSTSTTTQVTFSWTDLTGPYPGASSTYPVNGYNVVRTPLGTGVPVTFADPDGASPFLDTTGTLGQLYTYRVQGTDDQGHLGPLSAPVTDAISNPPPLPAPIAILNGNEQVLLDWAPATLVAGSLPVSQYRITIDGGPPILTTQTWYLDTTASNGTPVTYTIESIDVTGQASSPAHISPASTPVSVTPDANLLNPPTGLTAVPLTPNSIRLNWVPSNDQGLDVDYYVITRANSFTGTYSSPITIDADAFPPVVSMAVTQLAADRTYYFVMRAYERTPGTRVSSPSNHAYAATPPNPGGSGNPSGDLFFDRNVMLLFNSETLAINFIPSEAGEAVVKIYTVSGYPILSLSGGTVAAGVQYSLTWDGLDRNLYPVASGLYLIEVTVGKFHMVKKVAVVK